MLHYIHQLVANVVYPMFGVGQLLAVPEHDADESYESKQ